MISPYTAHDTPDLHAEADAFHVSRYILKPADEAFRFEL
jgi:hypothetical protein